MLRKGLLQMLINLEWKTVLQKPRYVLAIVPVSIANREEVTVSEV